MSPICVTDDGIVISASDEQELKALSPIFVTDDGIVICVSDEHPSNEPPLIILIDKGIFTILIFFFTQISVS